MPNTGSFAPTAVYPFALAAVFLWAPAAMGQSIHGRALVAGDTVGVSGANLTLMDSAGLALLRVQADESGAFRISVPGPGEYQILATRIGFSSVRDRVMVGENEFLEVELRMAEEAIPLEPLLVVARREVRQGTLDEFYDRMPRMKRKGRGWFMTREEIERSGAASLSFVLVRAPGVFLQPTGRSGHAVQMRRPGEFCTPVLYVDGMPASYTQTPVMEDVEGIEVYRGQFESVEGYWPSRCGIIFLWRKPDWGNPFAWNRLFLAAGFVGLAAAIALIF